MRHATSADMGGNAGACVTAPVAPERWFCVPCHTPRRVIGELSEPFVALCTLAEAGQLLRAVGFGEIIHFGPEEVIARYFDGRSDVRGRCRNV